MFYTLTKIWLGTDENNLTESSPAQVDLTLQKLYQKADGSDYPKREILKMYRHQKEFKKHNHLRLA